MGRFKCSLIVLAIFSFFALAKSQRAGANICRNNQMIPCDNTQCILRDKWCDRTPDCADGTDEKYCKTHGYFTRTDNHCINQVHFTCANALCIPAAAWCDGFDDCGDFSDEYEIECEREEATTEEQFTDLEKNNESLDLGSWMKQLSNDHLTTAARIFFTPRPTTAATSAPKNIYLPTTAIKSAPKNFYLPESTTTAIPILTTNYYHRILSSTVSETSTTASETQLDKANTTPTKRKYRTLLDFILAGKEIEHKLSTQIKQYEHNLTMEHKIEEHNIALQYKRQEKESTLESEELIEFLTMLKEIQELSIQQKAEELALIVQHKAEEHELTLQNMKEEHELTMQKDKKIFKERKKKCENINL